MVNEQLLSHALYLRSVVPFTPSSSRASSKAGPKTPLRRGSSFSFFAASPTTSTDLAPHQHVADSGTGASPRAQAPPQTPSRRGFFFGGSSTPLPESSDAPLSPPPYVDPTGSILDFARSPKFSGADAIASLVSGGVVPDSRSAADVLDGLVSCGYAVRSRGSANQDAAACRLRFSDKILDAGKGLERTRRLRESADAGERAAGEKRKRLISALAVLVAVFARTFCSSPSSFVRGDGLLLSVIALLLLDRHRELLSSSSPPAQSKIASPKSPTAASANADADTASSSSAASDPAVTPLHVSELSAKLRTAAELYNEFRYIEAGLIVAQARATLSSTDASLSSGLSSASASQSLSDASATLSAAPYPDLEARYAESSKALKLLTTGDDWELYKVCADGSTVHTRQPKPNLRSVKICGINDASTLACLACWKEGDLYKHWFPVCSWANILNKISETEVVFEFGGGTLPFKGDNVLRGFGVDYLSSGFFLILGGSVKDDGKGKVIPERLMTIRNNIPELSISVEPIDGKSCRNTIIATLLLPEFLPKSLVEFMLSMIFAQVIGSMSKLARKIDLQLAGEDEGEMNEHAKRILDNEFYKGVVEPKIKTFIAKKKNQ